jgi:hypothetical protein
LLRLFWNLPIGEFKTSMNLRKLLNLQKELLNKHKSYCIRWMLF